MGLFGGGNSKTEVEYELSDSRQNVSLNQTQGPAVISRGNVNLTYLDQGAIQGGLSLAQKALDHGGAVAKTAFDFGNNALMLTDRSASRAFNFATDVQRQADESQRDSLKAVEDTSKSALSYVDAANRSDLARNFDQLIKWGGIAAVVMAVAFVMRGQ